MIYPRLPWDPPVFENEGTPEKYCAYCWWGYRDENRTVATVTLVSLNWLKQLERHQVYRCTRCDRWKYKEYDLCLSSETVVQERAADRRRASRRSAVPSVAQPPAPCAPRKPFFTRVTEPAYIIKWPK